MERIRESILRYLEKNGADMVEVNGNYDVWFGRPYSNKGDDYKYNDRFMKIVADQITKIINDNSMKNYIKLVMSENGRGFTIIVSESEE